MNARRILIAMAAVLAAAGPCGALVVVDESFDTYDVGTYLPGQGGWTGPFYQYAGDPHDTQGPMVVDAPDPPGGHLAKWEVMPGSDFHSVSVTCTFPGEWTSGVAVMYIDVGMDATDGPGNFSYFQMFDSSGREATRIYLRRYSGTTGDIHVLGRASPSDPNPWLPDVVVDPDNNVMYKLKLEVDVTNRKYDVWVGDGDRSGVNPGHWGHYDGHTLILDGVPAVDDIYFYYNATGLARFNWLMYRCGDLFTGPAYALCDNIYIEGPDDAVGVNRTEIWVATGTYAEQVTLREYAHICGGFAGDEISKADRDGAANPTVIDVTGLGPGATAVTGANMSSVDGFTIKGYCGVSSADSAVHVENNLVTGCAQAGVLCNGSSPVIANNTIVGNNEGISCTIGAAALRNNIVSLNTTGISASSGTPTLARNAVSGNTTDYSGLSPGENDISDDPMFADPGSGDYRLSLGSPCIDAGAEDEALLWDMDAAFRPVDGDGDGLAALDIGAFEFQIIPWALGLGAAKGVPGGTIIRCSDVVVSAAFTDFFYVQTDDRTCGIRVDKAGHGLSVGARVNVIGYLDTNENGELYIAAARIDPA